MLSPCPRSNRLGRPCSGGFRHRGPRLANRSPRTTNPGAPQAAAGDAKSDVRRVKPKRVDQASTRGCVGACVRPGHQRRVPSRRPYYGGNGNRGCTARPERPIEPEIQRRCRHHRRRPRLQRHVGISRLLFVPLFGVPGIVCAIAHHADPASALDATATS
jgi:hypothetical protein